MVSHIVWNVQVKVFLLEATLNLKTETCERRQTLARQGLQSFSSMASVHFVLGGADLCLNSVSTDKTSAGN